MHQQLISQKAIIYLKNLVDLGNGDSGLQVPFMDWFRVIFKNGKKSFVTLNLLKRHNENRKLAVYHLPFLKKNIC
jgi:hypothetical protein